MKLNDLITMSTDKDSKEEEYFEWYLNDLIDAGYVIGYYRSKTIKLTDGISYDYVQAMKTKDKVCTRVVAPALVYTPDYTILWNKKAENLFYIRYDTSKPVPISIDKPKLFPKMLAKEIEEHVVSIIDVKPDMASKFNTFSSSATFVVKQALLKLLYDVIVDKVKIKQLMKNSFTSKRYMLTDKSKQKRKIKWATCTLKDYVNKINNAV